MALLASVADGAVLWGIRAFMEILSGEGALPLYGWLCLMLGLIFLRLVLLFLKVRISESWIFAASSRVTAWFLHRLRLLHPKNFHTPLGNLKVEAAYESTLVLQNNGAVVFQGAQAVLQLAVFLPALLYISWPLTLFLFVVVVPVVGALQRKLHKLGPVEENLLRSRSKFRNDLNLARRLFLRWSSRSERSQVSSELLELNRKLCDDGLLAGLRKNSLSLLTESVSVVAMVLVLAFCAVLIRHGWMDGSGLVLFCSAVLLSYKPVKECARVLPQMRSVGSAIKILEDFEKAELKNSCRNDFFDFENCKNKTADLKNVENKILVKNGNFKYDGSDHSVFTNLNLEWLRKKPILVRGKNGAGKSTFLRLLAGLELWNVGSVECARDVFFVAQDLELPPRRFLKELIVSAEISKAKILESFLRGAGVESLLQKPGLSGGERARVALLWALATNCKTVLLDEPFASIALADREKLLNDFLNAAEALGKWVAIVSHDVLSLAMESRFDVIQFDELFALDKVLGDTSNNMLDEVDLSKIPAEKLPKVESLTAEYSTAKFSTAINQNSALEEK